MALITGTVAGETLLGAGYSDQIYGNGGNDIIDSGGGDDYVEAGTGTDLIHAGAGADFVNLDGGGNDIVYGGDGDDLIQALSPDVFLTRTVKLYGEAGNDRFSVNDTYGGASYLLDGGEGNDNFLLQSGQGIVVLGGTGDDFVRLTGGAGVITLGDGHDMVRIEAGGLGEKATIVDFQVSGVSSDRLEFANLLKYVAPTWDGTSNPFTAGYLRLEQSGADTLVQVNPSSVPGNFSTVLRLLGVQASTVNADMLGGFDPAGGLVTGLTLTGGADADVLSGSSGDDLLQGGEGDDSLDGFWGDDILKGGAGNDILHSWDAGDDKLYGGDGNDGLSYQGFLAGSDHVLLDGGAGNDSIEASAFFTSSPVFVIDGGAGDDFIWVQTKDGATVHGGTGDDHLYSSVGRDYLNGGAGDDEANYWNITSGVTVDLSVTGPQNAGGAGTDTLISIERLRGSDYDDVLTGSTGGGVTVVSTNAAGDPANANVDQAVLSADGLKVAFVSSAYNLVANDMATNAGIFVKDLVTGTVVRASVDASGERPVGATADFGKIGLSTDGTEVVFASSATYLVASDTNSTWDIFVKDLTTGAMTRISTDSSGVQANGGSFNPVFSADGSKVAFSSTASNLVAGDTNNDWDTFVKDLTTGEVTRVSTDALGNQTGSGWFDQPTISADGAKVAFSSGSAALVAGDHNGVSDIFVKNLTTGAVVRVNTDAQGNEANAGALGAVFSPDGTKVAFYSDASNLVTGDTNQRADIFVKDLFTGAIIRVTTDAQGNQALPSVGGGVILPVFWGDGSKIAFYSDASNLVPGDANGFGDIFLKDLTTGAIERISVTASGGQVNGTTSQYLSLSADGDKAVFSSLANYFGEGIVPNATLYLKDLTSGNEGLSGGEGDDVLEGKGGDDTLDGGPGIDAASYASAAAGVTVSLALIGAQDTGEGHDTLIAIENLVGSAHADVLIGDGDANNLRGGDSQDWLQGGAGADILLGGEGHDSVWGGGGDDLLNGGNGDDTLDGGAGIDTVTYARADARVEVDLSILEDQATRGGGTDTLISIENLVGSSYDDVLTGAAGANALAGGIGADVLTGGGGADRFVYINLSDSTVAASDLITDFTRGVDRIDLSAFDADRSTTGDQAFHLGATSGHVGDIVTAYDASSGQTSVSLYVDGDTSVDALIWLSGNLTSLATSDFVL